VPLPYNTPFVVNVVSPVPPYPTANVPANVTGPVPDATLRPVEPVLNDVTPVLERTVVPGEYARPSPEPEIVITGSIVYQLPGFTN